MTDDILEDVTFMIVMIIIGAVVCVIGYAFQNGWIVGFGIVLAGAVPVLRLVIEILKSV